MYKMKKYYGSWAILAGLWITACTEPNQPKEMVPSVKLEQVKAASEETSLQYPGKVKAAQDVNLAFKVSGTLARIYVDEGKPVQAGQLLAELDPTDYQVQLDATEAQYLQVKAEAERVMALYQEGAATSDANDKATYGLKQITAKYKHHQDELAYTKLYAPFSGAIQKRIFEAHETVGAGMPVLSMISGGTPEVEINLPAAAYIHRDRFSTFSCTFDLYPGETYTLKPISITPKANANQLYTMRLKLADGAKSMPSPGMNTMVTIRYTEDEGTPECIVPTTALRTEGGKTLLFVYQAEGTVKACPVETLRLLNNGHAVVKAADNTLKPGDQVVAAGVREMKEGACVKPMPQTTETNVGGLL